MSGHPEIQKYRENMKTIPPSAHFLLRVEEGQYEEMVEEALTKAIPRLYALAFEDETDVPSEVYQLIERLGKDLALNIEWSDEYE